MKVDVGSRCSQLPQHPTVVVSGDIHVCATLFGSGVHVAGTVENDSTSSLVTVGADNAVCVLYTSTEVMQVAVCLPLSGADCCN